MSDLISRQETIKYIRENLPLSTFMHRGVKQADIACWDVCNMIADRVPSAESERKKGKWIKDETTYPGPFTDNYVCSECGRIGGDWIKGIRQDQMYPFCPFCGADMRGDE